MALFDIDRSSHDRSNPMPNTHDLSYISSAPIVDTPKQALQTLSSTYATPATNVQGVRMVFKNNLLVTYDQNNKVSSVYGYVPGALSTGPVLIVAKNGYDVFTDILNISRPAGL